MAVELLNKKGIHFIVLAHLPNTYLDGACFYASNRRPVVGMTLRHDRLDNFWFTLVHELAHLYLHLDERQAAFFDDTEAAMDDKSHPEEQQANEFTRNAFVPLEIWEKVSQELIQTTDDARIVNIAERLNIHLAIVAGRLRWETHDYKRFTSLIGYGKVQPQFYDHR